MTDETKLMPCPPIEECPEAIYLDRIGNGTWTPNQQGEWQLKYIRADLATPSSEVVTGSDLFICRRTVGGNSKSEYGTRYYVYEEVAPYVSNSEAFSERIKNYSKGSWFKAKSIDEMQAFYMSRLPAIRTAAREQGYAIGLHGSTRRDLDLIAIPWRENPCSKESLAQAIQSAACGIAYDEIKPEMWEKKPCGRYAIALPICWTDHSEPFKDMLSAGHIDLSVMMEPMNSEAAERVRVFVEKYSKRSSYGWSDGANYSAQDFKNEGELKMAEQILRLLEKEHG